VVLNRSYAVVAAIVASKLPAKLYLVRAFVSRFFCGPFRRAKQNEFELAVRLESRNLLAALLAFRPVTSRRHPAFHPSPVADCLQFAVRVVQRRTPFRDRSSHVRQLSPPQPTSHLTTHHIITSLHPTPTPTPSKHATQYRQNNKHPAPPHPTSQLLLRLNLNLNLDLQPVQKSSNQTACTLNSTKRPA
jgi:hypothetical protein